MEEKESLMGAATNEPKSGTNDQVENRSTPKRTHCLLTTNIVLFLASVVALSISLELWVTGTNNTAQCLPDANRGFERGSYMMKKVAALR